jgi:DNA-binding transcriptional MerR regulator
MTDPAAKKPPAALARLNIVVILEALGLTLSQIRAVLAENPPSLLRILGGSCAAQPMGQRPA